MDWSIIVLLQKLELYLIGPAVQPDISSAMVWLPKRGIVAMFGFWIKWWFECRFIAVEMGVAFGMIG